MDIVNVCYFQLTEPASMSSMSLEAFIKRMMADIKVGYTFGGLERSGYANLA